MNLIRCLLLLLVILPITGQAQFFSFPFYYSTNNNEVTITRYVGTSSSLTIPSTLNGLPVTVIGVNAFHDFPFSVYSGRLTSIIIPDTVKSIDTNAFSFCTNLVNLSIGNNVTNIGDKSFFGCTRLASVVVSSNVVNLGISAFANCSKLTNIIFPSVLTNIGLGALDNCPQLLSISVDPNNLVYSSVDGILFNQLQTALVVCPNARTGGFIIPDGITTICDNAFQYCSGLTSIVIPNSVTNMGNSTFQYCSSLTNASIGTGIVSISASAFYSCSSLVNVTFSPSLASIGDTAFGYCGSLTTFIMPNTVTNTGNSTFTFCTNLVKATISTKATTIGNSLFWNCQNLRDVTIPDGVITIGNGAFGNGTAITSLIIPDSVTSIGAYAFNACYQLTYLQMGSSVTNIGQRAFLGCSALTKSVTMPKGLLYIGDYGFSVCFRVPAIFFQGDAPALGTDALWDNLAATVYYLPDTQGWTNSFGGIPAVLWNPVMQTSDGNFGLQNNQFGFNITGTTNIPIVVEACTNLVTSKWTAMQTCTITNGLIYFDDPKWTNFSGRFYRIRSP